MNIVRSWREQKVILKWWFPILSDMDFDYDESEREKMLTKLGRKLKKSRAELETLFAELQLY